ncbi:hypothetical protein LCGC14_1301820 [marine sediment metagenome]|uniref:Uncharacterized protein n=1 Tax=marine sediment metagenome TaxID=412755 RepID=A0A0F9NS96_9ZZZZ
MNPNRQNDKFSQTSSKPRLTVSRPFKSPDSYISTQDKSSNGASPNPVKHELEMIKRKPNIKRLLKEVDKNDTRR